MKNSWDSITIETVKSGLSEYDDYKSEDTEELCDDNKHTESFQTMLQLLNSDIEESDFDGYEWINKFIILINIFLKNWIKIFAIRSYSSLLAIYISCYDYFIVYCRLANIFIHYFVFSMYFPIYYWNNSN